jgi:cytochrome b6-f complex iron-sulfur subunit
VIGRRDALTGGGACALAALLGCGRRREDTGGKTSDTSLPDTTPTTCADDIEPGGEGWVSVAMRDHPALYTPGGSAAVDIPAALLQVVVIHLEDGCFATVWRICTHGACETEWTPDVDALVCPCHESHFATDGAVLQGPATVPLRAFQTVRRDDTLWIWRPL